MMNSEQGTTGSALGGGRRVPLEPVPAGYKRTEVGVIPEDWERSSVRAIASSTRNAIVGGPFGSDLVSKDYVAHGVPVIRGQNMSGRWVSGSFVFVTPTKAKSLEANLAHPGDIIFTQRGTLGQVSLVPAKPFSAYLVSQSQMKLSVNRKVADPLFLFYFFTSYEQQKSIQGRTIQTGVPHINLGILREMPVRLPPLAEQCAIAEALSDVDGLLTALEALIAKKRAVKQAAMQQLLTGKSRLPGFSGTWETKRLGEIGEISGAGVDKKIRPNEIHVRLVNYLDVYRKTFLYSKDLTHEVSAKQDQIWRCAVEKGDIFFTPTSEVRDDIGRSAVAMEDIADGVYSYHVVRLRLIVDWDLRFRAYVFNTKRFYAQASMLCEGSGTRYVITLPKFRSIFVHFPPKMEEQRAIASVLSDMDAEIAALEQRRDKTRTVKQGMMQQLLTGRVRLVKPGLDRMGS